MLVRDKFEVEYSTVFDKYRIGSTIWSPLAKGVLTGKYNESLDVEGRLKTFRDDQSS